MKIPDAVVTRARYLLDEIVDVDEPVCRQEHCYLQQYSWVFP